MTTAQRIIKYLAIAFAAVLVIGIISGIVSLLDTLTGFTVSDPDYIGEFTETRYDGEITELKIEVKAVEFEIKEGDVFSVGTDNEHISHSLNGTTLTVKEDGVRLFSGRSAGRLVLTIPEGYAFSVVEIDAGAGVMEIDGLSAEKVDFDLGAGEVIMKHLTVRTSADIEGGTGKVEITDADITDLDFDLGIGKVELKGKLSGNSKLDFGVGEAVIGLAGSLDDYSITVDKGLGSVSLDGKSVTDGRNYGSGDSVIKMDGGVGSIEVYFYD